MKQTIPLAEGTEVSRQVSQNLRVAMLRAQVSSATLSDTLGISGAALWRRMSGQVSWSIDELSAAASLVEIDVRELL